VQLAEELTNDPTFNCLIPVAADGTWIKEYIFLTLAIQWQKLAAKISSLY
jgi:hypothetical protein